MSDRTDSYLTGSQTSQLTQAEVVARLRADVNAAGSQRAWARAHGVSVPYVNDVLRGRRDPGEKILRPLGLAVVVRYERQYAAAVRSPGEGAE